MKRRERTNQIQTKEFDNILRETIDNTFKEILGESVARSIFYQVGGESFSEEIEFIAEALERILGSGAFILERLALEKLYTQFGTTFQEKGGCRFVDYVNEARKAWLKRMK